MKALALLAILAACGSPSNTVDAPLAHQDAAVDAHADARPDAPADAPADAPSGPTAGIIEVSQGADNTTSSANVTAHFSDLSLFGPVIGSDGPCTIYSVATDSKDYSAGTLTITGTASPITVTPSGTAPNVLYSDNGTVPDPAFTAGATITFTAAGGPDVGAFTASVTAPAALAGFTPPMTISRTGYTATWTAGAGPTIWVILAATDTMSAAGDEVICRVNDTGSFTVPPTTFAMIPATYSDGYVGLGRVSPTVVTVGSVSVGVQATSFRTAGPVTITN